MPNLELCHCGKISGKYPIGLENRPLQSGVQDTWYFKQPRGLNHVVAGDVVAFFHPTVNGGQFIVKCERPLKFKLHYWEIKVHARNTEYIYIIGLGDESMNRDPRSPQEIGHNLHSIGITDGDLLKHNNQKYLPEDHRYLLYGASFNCKRGYNRRNKHIGILVDTEKMKVTFLVNNIVVFDRFSIEGMSGNIFPIEASWNNHVTMTTVSKVRNATGLQDLCRNKIRQNVETPEEMSDLGLPEALVTYMREYVDPTKKYRGF